MLATNGNWDETEVLMLRRLIKEGRSFSQIEQLIGKSRNACIGKASRLGITILNAPWKNDPNYVNQKKRNKIASAQRREERRKEREREERRAEPDRKIKDNPKALPPQFIPTVSRDPLNLTMAQLSLPELPIQCRYICNDDMSAPLYCGHSTHKGTSWCAFHHARVFTARVPHVDARPIYKARAA